MNCYSFLKSTCVESERTELQIGVNMILDFLLKKDPAILAAILKKDGGYWSPNGGPLVSIKGWSSNAKNGKWQIFHAYTQMGWVPYIMDDLIQPTTAQIAIVNRLAHRRGWASFLREDGIVWTEDADENASCYIVQDEDGVIYYRSSTWRTVARIAPDGEYTFAHSTGKFFHHEPGWSSTKWPSWI